MKDYKQFIKQLPSNTIVCALGEFNPPTVAHELLIKTVQVVAEQRKADHAVYTSPSDLISEEKKENFLKLMFPKTKFQSLGESFFISTVKQLTEKYRKVVIIAGADQFDEFKKLKESSNVEIISIGDKDPDVNHAKMKQYATKGLYEDFKKLLPSTIRDIDGKRLMNEMRTGMQLEPIKEQLVLVKDKLREKYFKGQIFNIGDIVESNGQRYEIVKRGSNHLLLKEETGELVSKWIHDVKQVKEAVIQPTGTDKIEANAPESDTGAKQEMIPKSKTKGFLTFYNYKTGGTPTEGSRSGNKNALGNENVMGTVHEQVSPAVDDAAKKAKATAAMVIKQAKEKEALKAKHTTEKEKLQQANESLDVVTPTAEEIAAKHNVSVEDIKKQIEAGIKIEHEHATADKTAEEIARDHLAERPDYYKRLKRFVEGVPEPTGELKDACWKGYTAVGTKKKNGKTVPNCVPVNESALNPLDPHGDYKAKRKAIQDIQMDPETNNDSELKAEVIRRKADLEKEYEPHRIKEETNEQSVDRKKQLKRFQQQAKSSMLNNIVVPEPTQSLPSSELPFDPFFKEEFLDEMVNQVTDEEIEDLYEENEIVLVYEDTGEEVESHPEEYKIDLMEVLSRQERLKGKIRLRKTSAKRSRSTRIALKRFSPPETINKRARRLAIKLMKKRMLRGRDPSKISVGEKERIEKALSKRKATINTIAMKLVPRIRKVEKSRMSHGKVTKGSIPSVF